MSDAQSTRVAETYAQKGLQPQNFFWPAKMLAMRMAMALGVELKNLVARTIRTRMIVWTHRRTGMRMSVGMWLRMRLRMQLGMQSETGLRRWSEMGLGMRPQTGSAVA